MANPKQGSSASPVPPRRPDTGVKNGTSEGGGGRLLGGKHSGGQGSTNKGAH